MISRTSFAIASAVLMLSAGAAHAQIPTREISLAGGLSEFDASGTGMAPVMALRVGAPLVGRWMVGDLNLSYTPIGEQFSDRTTRLGVAEGQLQAQMPASHVRPYIGIGGGWLHYFNNAAGRGATSPTYSGALGLRVPVASLLFRGEGRVRVWRSSANTGLHNNALEWTAGLGYAF